MFFWTGIFVIAGHLGGAHIQHHNDNEDNSRDSIVDVNVKALNVQDNLYVNGVLQDDGRVCVQKISMSEKTEYEEMMVCDHKSEERCYDTYITVFVPHQVPTLCHS